MKYKKIPNSELRKVNTLGELKDLGYQPLSIKEELRNNLVSKLKCDAFNSLVMH